MSPDESMRRIDALLSHVWMVRTFLKHSDEVDEVTDLHDVHRDLYDCMHALGAAWKAGDAAEYMRMAEKKYTKLRQITEQFIREQPDISSHMNFQMASRSLRTAVDEIGKILADVVS